MKNKIPPADANALMYAGWLGHQVVVLTDAAKDRPERRAPFQTNTVASARKYCREECAGQNPTIYKRAGEGWKAVR